MRRERLKIFGAVAARLWRSAARMTRPSMQPGQERGLPFLAAPFQREDCGKDHAVGWIRQVLPVKKAAGVANGHW